MWEDVRNDPPITSPLLLKVTHIILGLFPSFGDTAAHNQELRCLSHVLWKFTINGYMICSTTEYEMEDSTMPAKSSLRTYQKVPRLNEILAK